MPRAVTARIDVRDVALHDPAGRRAALAELPGVQVVVLMRHRH